MNGNDTLARLAAVLESRKPAAGGDPEKSYAARLYSKGTDAILKKVGEEATEVVIAAKGGQRDELVYEVADLVFHLLVLLGHKDIPPDAVYQELSRRFGISGIDEKNSRQS